MKPELNFDRSVAVAIREVTRARAYATIGNMLASDLACMYEPPRQEI